MGRVRWPSFITLTADGRYRQLGTGRWSNWRSAIQVKSSTFTTNLGGNSERPRSHTNLCYPVQSPLPTRTTMVLRMITRKLVAPTVSSLTHSFTPVSLQTGHHWLSMTAPTTSFQWRSFQ